MATSPAERLVGVRAKIERAKDHVEEFDRRFHSFRADYPYQRVTQENPQAGQQIASLVPRCPAPPILSVVAGEAIHQLRSSLEHLAWQLVEAAGLQSPTSKTGFPIFQSEADYKAQSPAKVKGMSADAINFINGLKPYQGGNDDLWRLHKLNNIDKHNLLLVIAYPISEIRFVSTRRPDGLLGSTAVYFQSPFKIDPRLVPKVMQDCADLIQRTVLVGEEVNQNLNVTFEVMFGDPEIVRGYPVLPFLHQMSRLVNGIVDQCVSANLL